MKKIISILLVLCLSLCFLPVFATAQSADMISILSARNIATAFAAVWPFADADGNIFSLGSDFTLGHSQPVDNTDCVLFDILSAENEEAIGYVIISLDPLQPHLTRIGLGDAPQGNALAATIGEVQDTQQTEDAAEENETLLEALSVMKTMSFKDSIIWLFDQIIYRLRYSLGSIWYGFEWDAETANRCVEEAIREYAATHTGVVTQVYTVDKNFCKPHTQGYFFEDEEYFDGICGVAAWEMLLGYYRDGCGYDKLPDDQTMYREIMVIMNGLTERFLGGLDFLSDLNDIVTKYTDYYIPHDIRAHEIIGTLDAGIAVYLYQKGYEQEAKNVLRNLSVNIPLLTSLKRDLLLSDLQAEIADWIYDETDGEVSLLTGIANSAEDIIVRSLKRGEPVVIGNWFSLDESRFTNHYFTAVGLYQITCTVALTEGMEFSFDRQLIEIYDTWSNYGSSLLDLDNLMLKSMSNANSIAFLAK